MTTTLKQLVDDIEKQLKTLERERFTSAFANDLYEAVDYWWRLGTYASERNTKINFPERARGELLLLHKLQQLLREKPENQHGQYPRLFTSSEELLEMLKEIQPPSEGHLGFLKTVHESFSFLKAEYNFSVVDTQPTSVRFSSGKVLLNLECIENVLLSCSFGPETDRSSTFWIQDLLYMNGDSRYRTLPDPLSLKTPGEVNGWFAFVASVFKQYGRPVLCDQPGIFDRLARAQVGRDQEYIDKMNVKSGAQKSNKSDTDGKVD
jgi:hypothetical protein